ncbi:hypothetical protein [uncultured Dokdonia sp.]|uniref:hypothetical protein n=1 Tax=uncultured Dokdonia sp. TaxID=575653 RepID=UPI002622B9E3|nr:hypothetical protein [uncultured Dokdonia sp.]
MTKAYLINPNELIRDYNEVIDEAQKKTFFTVGIELQKEEIDNLQTYIDKLSVQRKEFAEKNNGNEANLIYCFERLAMIIQSELKMLVSLKEDEMAQAWDILVDCQVHLGTVIRNYPFESDHLEHYLNRLHSYEKTLFPKMIFNSYGGFVKQSHCSICKSDYGDCDHIKGKLYNGEMCTRNITEVELEEISVVENPANKHCRVISIETNGIKKDVLTLREISTKS